MQNKFDVIIPVKATDLPILRKNIKYIKNNICNYNCLDAPPVPIFVILDLSKYNNEFDDISGVTVIDENKIIPGLSFQAIYDYLKQYGAEKRTGWYFQQFLKMAYSLRTKNDFYLSWDADTVPIKNQHFFENGRPIFFMKNEYNKAYFDTIQSLLGISKTVKSKRSIT